MDWFSWLSRTNLDPSLIYEYGLEFARNELQSEDLVYFDHEFLLSMGISVAKHRLEILKLAKKDVGPSPISLSKLFSAISKTKKGIKKRIAKWVFPQVSAVKALPEPEPEPEPEVERYGDKWRGALSLARKFKTEKELNLERPPTPVIKPIRRQAKSGPLDRRRMQENLTLTDNRSLKLSGPLDGKMNERLVFAYRSPKLCGTPERVHPRFMIPPSRSPPQPHWSLDGRSVSPNGYYYSDFGKERTVNADSDDHSLWPSLFQDMKPT